MTDSTTPGTATSDGGIDQHPSDGGIDQRGLTCAAAVLTSGENDVTAIAVLTDEEILALDGVDTAQFVPMPFLDEKVPSREERELLARTAARILMTRRDVISEVEASEAEERPLAEENLRKVTVEPTLTGVLFLRRSSRAVVMFERQVSEQTHRLYYYLHRDGVVLEEEVTADGVHMFTVMPQEKAVPRIHYLIDQAGIGGEDGEALDIPVDQLENHPELGERLADTRAFTMATMLSTQTGDHKQLTFHMTSTEVFAGQPDESGTTITIMPVGADSVDTLIRELFDAAGELEGAR